MGVVVFAAFVINEATSEMKTSSLLHVAIVKAKLWYTLEKPAAAIALRAACSGILNKDKQKSLNFEGWKIKGSPGARSDRII